MTKFIKIIGQIEQLTSIYQCHHIIFYVITVYHNSYVS